MANHINAKNILSTLSPETAQVLETHFRQQVANEIASGLVSSPAKPTRRTGPKAGSGSKRKMVGDVSASEFIRSCDSSMSVKDVVAKALEAGTEISEALVYNVRANAKKKAELAADAEATAKKEEEKRAKKSAALEKARAVRKANIEKRAAEANQATAKK